MIPTYRATSEAESLHLLAAGATRTISDERESALRTAHVLLTDILKRDPAGLVEEIRRIQESKEADKLELAMLKKAGVVNALRNERVIKKDSPRNSFFQRVSDDFAPMFDNIRSWGNQPDDGSQSSRTAIDKSDEVAGVAVEEDQLGILVCEMPTKKTETES